MKQKDREQIKKQILCALAHDEAEDGLYLRNFTNLTEEDERPAVEADDYDIVESLNELIKEGKVWCEQTEAETIFHIASKDHPHPESFLD